MATQGSFGFGDITGPLKRPLSEAWQDLQIPADGNKLAGEDLSVRLSGAGNANLRDVTCKTLTVTLSGAGNATVSGTAEKVTAKISGAGDIDAAALKAASADVQVSGAGDITVWATDELKARLRGAPLVFFDGTVWRDDELVAAGLGQKTGQSMGHISMSGNHGAIESLAGLDIARKVFLHINNSNPVLLNGSDQRRHAEHAGWQVPSDGTEITL